MSALKQHPEIVDRIRDAPPDTAVCYGNGQTETIESIVESGDYDIEVAPDHCKSSLVSIHAITCQGHSVTFTHKSVTISDMNGRYTRTYPRVRGASDWVLPMNILKELTELRKLHPPHHQRLCNATQVTLTQRNLGRPNPPTQLRLSHILSARLYSIPRSMRQRVMRLHYRCGHKPADVMTAMVSGETPLWLNTRVTAAEIQKVFTYEPCLFCVLSKKRKEGADQWMKTHSYDWTKKLHKKYLRTMDSKAQADKQEEEDMTRYTPGECLSCDNVGPINPQSVDGFTCFFLFRDTYSRRLHVFPARHADEETYLDFLYQVLQFYHNRGFKTKTIRTDYFSTFISDGAKAYYRENDLQHQASTAYKHWQNAVERDVQTVVCNVSAVIHSADLIRADAWAQALVHWVALWNDTPLSASRTSPNALVFSGHSVDATYQYRFAFGDVVCYSLEKKDRKWKFDLKNEVGFYFGDEKGVKGGVRLYRPFSHDIVMRGDVHRLPVSDVQLLQWYGRRYETRQAGLPFRVVRDALVNWIPEEPVEVLGDESEEGESDPDPLGDPNNESGPEMAAPYGDEVPDHPDIIRVPVDVLPEDTRPTEPLEGYEPRRTGRKRGAPIKLSLTVNAVGTDHPDDDENGAELYHADLNVGRVRLALSETELVNRAVESTKVDDQPSGHHERSILSTYRVLTMNEDVAKNGNSSDVDEENLSTKEALEAHDAPQFKEAIKSEVLGNLLSKTKTLRPIGRGDLVGRKYVFIETTLKCKRKKKGNGLPDKHKSRAAARGDQYSRKVLKNGGILPPSYSPTIAQLTFAFILQLATSKKLKCATMDITAAYLQVPIPEETEWIVTKLEPFVAKICNLDPDQLYKIDKYLYGLPDSGRAFYIHYKSALIEEGYAMSDMDPCLFYRITYKETTYIMLFVDDTYIYSNDQKYIDEVIRKMGKHYEVTLDMKAESFLGIQFDRDKEGNVKLLQPKLMTKLFKEHPEVTGKRTRKPPRHPYGPAPAHGKDPAEGSPAIEITKYLHLLGLLMYLCHSRPDIMAAVSFGATKSANPTQYDFDNLLYIVEYLRHTKSKGHTIRPGNSDSIQFYCYVDASYLVHSDSKGHTGYCIGTNNVGTFYNCSRKQTLVSTSSTHAEMRAIFTLVKDILFLIYICHELQVQLTLPAIVMEDNSAVITVTGDHSAYVKKCKHFLMILNYVKEQVALGIVDIRKIKGTLNWADLHTKKVRDPSFETHADGILGQTQV